MPAATGFVMHSKPGYSQKTSCTCLLELSVLLNIPRGQENNLTKKARSYIWPFLFSMRNQQRVSAYSASSNRATTRGGDMGKL